MSSITNGYIVKLGCVCMVAVIIIISIWMWKSKKAVTEKLSNVSGTSASDTSNTVSQEPSHATEGKQEDIQIKPSIYDAGSGTIMSGPEYVPSQYMSPWYQTYTGDLKNHYLLDDGEGGNAGLQFNMCSKSCCSEQYPLPFKMPVDSAVCNSKSEFVPTNYTCNNAWQDSGCVCMTKHQADFLGSRGGNA